jgi:enoyl-CoA hydratase/carnithine racemase
MNARVKRELNDGVLRLTLADPATRNSLSKDMMSALADALADDNGARVIVIAAEGTAFSSGHNLKDISAHQDDAAYCAALFRQCSDLMQAIVAHRLPVIAEVQGIASAAGCQLVASCDLAIASEKAGFCTPGVDIGLFCSTPMVALSRAVAPKHAKEMLFTGDVISAAEAQRFGLVNRVAPASGLRAETEKLARKIAAKHPATVATGKAAFARQHAAPLAEAYAAMSEVMTCNALRDDAKEGIAAFLEKRKPNWASVA